MYYLSSGIFQGRVVLDDGSHLRLSNTLSADSGNYTCEVHFVDGAAFVYQQSTSIIVQGMTTLAAVK